MNKPILLEEIANVVGSPVAEIDGEYRIWVGNDDDSTEAVTAAQITQAQSNYDAKVSEYEAQEISKASAAVSGNQKLLDLGLTQEEATALTGYIPPTE